MSYIPYTELGNKPKKKKRYERYGGPSDGDDSMGGPPVVFILEDITDDVDGELITDDVDGETLQDM